MNKFLKESALWILIILPFLYLATIWTDLPQQVPIHFNLVGHVDQMSDKTTLVYLIGILGIGIYLLMLVIPYFDPNRKIQLMGKKYYNFRFIITLFFSLLVTYMLYISKTASFENPNILFALIGTLLAVLGNYSQTIRPNYLIGIRTPWTLENEQTWKKTHHFGGRIWMVGGILITIMSFLIRNNLALAINLGAFLSLMVLLPVLYSYFYFQKQKKISFQ